MTNLMQEPIWKNWAERIQKMGLQNFAAALLEATGPLNLIGAQMVYLGQPMLNSMIEDKHLQALANFLEEPEQTKAFIKFLKDDIE